MSDGEHSETGDIECVCVCVCVRCNELLISLMKKCVTVSALKDTQQRVFTYKMI